jgi:hypothetical protein
METAKHRVGRRLHPRAILFLMLWLGLMVAGRSRMLQDPGTFWHPVVGQRMLDERAVIHTDPFSFTFGGRPWIAQQWLGECVMGWVERHLGLDGLLLAAVTLLAWVFSGLGWRALREGMSPPAAVVLVMLAIGASSYHFHPRPHLATIALFAWMVGLLIDAEAGRVSGRRLIWLPIAFVLWTNVHGGVLGGIATVLFVLLGWSANRTLLPSSDKWRLPALRSPWFVLLAVACVASVFVNPYGRMLPQVWLSLMDSRVLPGLIVEHAALEWMSTEGAMIAALAVAYLVLLARCWKTQRRVTWLIPCLWLVMAHGRIRHGPLFAVAVAVVIADMRPFANWLSAPRGAVADSSTRRWSRGRLIGIALPASLVLAAICIQWAGVRAPVVGRGWATCDPTIWPIDTSAMLKEAIEERPGASRVFNDMRYGGYLIAKVPESRVYVDDRCELYGDDFLSNYRRVMASPDQFEREARKGAFEFALVSRGTPICEHLSNSLQWRKLCEDAASTLFERSGAAGTAQVLGGGRLAPAP